MKKYILLCILYTTTLFAAQLCFETISTKGEVMKIPITKGQKKLEINKGNIKEIKGLKNSSITEILVTYTEISTIDFMPMNIEKCIIISSKIETLKPVPNYNTLYYLYIDTSKIKDITPIFDSRSIKTVIIGDCQVDTVKCTDNESIEKLDLSNNRYLVNVVDLGKVKNLKELCLYNTPLSKNINRLNEIRTKNPTVEIITD